MDEVIKVSVYLEQVLAPVSIIVGVTLVAVAFWSLLYCIIQAISSAGQK